MSSQRNRRERSRRSLQNHDRATHIVLSRNSQRYADALRTVIKSVHFEAESLPLSFAVWQSDIDEGQARRSVFALF
jgi:hypothetical protein